MKLSLVKRAIEEEPSMPAGLKIAVRDGADEREKVAVARDTAAAVKASILARVLHYHANPPPKPEQIE